MRLPAGITGFYCTKDNVSPTVDKKLFRQLCFNFMLNNGKVIEIGNPQNSANFHYAQVEISGDPFYILLNKCYPYLAFALQVKFEEIIFIDRPMLKEQFSPYYQVFGRDDLNALLSENLADMSELNAEELKQINYWKPETIGQIIFNYWD